MTRSPRSVAAALFVLLIAQLLGLTGCATATRDAPAESVRQSSVRQSSVADGVPARAAQTLREIDAGRWPAEAAPGTKGGDNWANREERLPRTGTDAAPIRYREWDVNPKQPGHTRDAERIITGSDGSAWYTGDHYQTFVRMR